MELRRTALADKQIDHLAGYLAENFGVAVSRKRMHELLAHINILRDFQEIAPVYMTYCGFIVRRMVRKHNHVFYTVHNEAVYIITLTDTRMSPATVRQLIKEELNKQYWHRLR